MTSQVQMKQKMPMPKLGTSSGYEEVKKIPLIIQDELLKLCVEQELDLAEELQKYGYSYDSLQYRRNTSPLFQSTQPYISVEDESFPYHGVPAVSFFAGSGGLDLGFEAAGFEHVGAFEIEKLFSETLRSNRPSWRIFAPPDFSGDLRNRDETEFLLKRIGIKAPFEGIFYGGPPCQPFSIAANQRFAKWGENFKRIGFSHEAYGNLLFDFISYIVSFLPRVFLIENVPGLATIDGGEQISSALEILSHAGYEVLAPVLLNASDYGVPQHRYRVVVIGWRSSREFSLPKKNTERVACARAFAKPVDSLPNHITRKHEAASVLRYMELDYGQRDHLGRVDRLDPEAPSKTVIAGGTKGGGRSHLHPHIPRTLSVRESARLQTFPDKYIFCGSPARQFTQVGNAVPPLLALRVARSIYESIYA